MRIYFYCGSATTPDSSIDFWYKETHGMTPNILLIMKKKTIVT